MKFYGSAWSYIYFVTCAWPDLINVITKGAIGESVYEDVSKVQNIQSRENKQVKIPET